jgi:hypothetical protein
MTVKNLESLVQRNVRGVEHVATEMRIVGKASGQTPASLSLSSPSYPPSGKPRGNPTSGNTNGDTDGRTWRDDQDSTVCRAGRPGSLRGVLRRGLSMSKPATLLAAMHREQHPAALATGQYAGTSAAITAIARARATVQFGPFSGFAASTRGKRAG